MPRSSAERAAPLCAAALAAAAQAPVLWNDFKWDDFLHLYDRANLPLHAFLLKPHGGHLYLTRNALFAACRAAFGLDAGGFLALALAAHALNVALLASLLGRLTSRPWLGAGMALVWGASLVHRGTLGWISAHGHAWVGTGILWVLGDAVALRLRGAAPGARRVALWLAVLVAVATSFGVGLALAAGAVAWLWPFLGPAARRPRTLAALASLALAVPALWAATHWGFAALTGATAPPVLPARPLWAIGHAPEIARLLAQLLAWGTAALLLGPWLLKGVGELPVGPLAALALPQLVAVAAGVLVVAASGVALAVRADRGRRSPYLGFAALALGAYASLAIGRTGFVVLEDWPTEFLAIQPRYHYVGSLALTGLLALALARALSAFPAAGRRVLLASGTWALLLASPFATGRWWTSDRGGRMAREEFDALRARLEREIRSRPRNRSVLIPNGRFRSVGDALAHPEQFPGFAAVFAISWPEDWLDGRRVYFVERSASVVASARANPASRISGLLLSEEEAAARAPSGSGRGPRPRSSRRRGSGRRRGRPSRRPRTRRWGPGPRRPAAQPRRRRSIPARAASRARRPGRGLPSSAGCRTPSARRRRCGPPPTPRRSSAATPPRPARTRSPPPSPTRRRRRDRRPRP
jgi:hypothetical protein